MTILIQTNIDAHKRAALMAVIQNLEEKASPQTTSRDQPSNWISATKVRKSPKKAS